MKPSLALQRQSLEHVLAVAGCHPADLVSPEIKEACRIGILTLAWLERRQELMKALDRLERERPDLVDLFREFPGSQIADVRPMFPACHNGSGADD
jgi:hypothetical protein